MNISSKREIVLSKQDYRRNLYGLKDIAIDVDDHNELEFHVKVTIDVTGIGLLLKNQDVIDLIKDKKNRYKVHFMEGLIEFIILYGSLEMFQQYLALVYPKTKIKGNHLIDYFYTSLQASDRRIWKYLLSLETTEKIRLWYIYLSKNDICFDVLTELWNDTKMRYKIGRFNKDGTILNYEKYWSNNLTECIRNNNYKMFCFTIDNICKGCNINCLASIWRSILLGKFEYLEYILSKAQNKIILTFNRNFRQGVGKINISNLNYVLELYRNDRIDLSEDLIINWIHKSIIHHNKKVFITLVTIFQYLVDNIDHELYRNKKPFRFHYQKIIQIKKNNRKIIRYLDRQTKKIDK
jgi:hypothetical protein